MFAKFLLVQDLLAIAQSAVPLVTAGGTLLPAVEEVALEAVSLVSHLSVDAAAKFVADVKALWAQCCVLYNGQSDAVAAFVVGVRKLIADLA